MTRNQTGPEFTENDLQAWLNNNLSEFIGSITNLDEVSTRLQEQIDSFYARSKSRLIDTLGDAVQAVLDSKLLHTLTALEEGSEIVSLGREFPLLESSLRGRNPAADILALQTESAAYAIIEVKISANAARQAVTELSAYGHGLGHRYLGLNSFDAIWVIVSTEYRPTLLDAIAYQVLVADRCVVPIKANVTANNGKIQAVELEIVELKRLPDICSTDAMFSNAVFDGVAVNLTERVSSPEVALHFISNACTRLGATGVCFQVLASDFEKREYPYPHGLYIGVLNPFKLYLLSEQLRERVAGGRVTRHSASYEDWLFRGIHESFDVDLRTFDRKWAKDDEQHDERLNFAGIPFEYSLLELSIRETNSLTVVFEPMLEQLLQMHTGKSGVEVGGTDFGAMFFPFMGRATYEENNIASVRYFGFLHDVVVYIAAFLMKSDPDFKGMTLADVYESPKLLLKLISIGKPANYGGM